MVFRMKFGVRLTSPLLDVDGVEPPVVGYYRSFFVEATNLASAFQIALHDVSDGKPYDVEGEVIEDLALVDPEIVAMMPSIKRDGDILWRSGRVLFPEDNDKARASKDARGRRSWYRRLFH